MLQTSKIKYSKPCLLEKLTHSVNVEHGTCSNSTLQLDRYLTSELEAKLDQVI